MVRTARATRRQVRKARGTESKATSTAKPLRDHVTTVARLPSSVAAGKNPTTDAASRPAAS